jgi:hypothetical protein
MCNQTGEIKETNPQDVDDFIVKVFAVNAGSALASAWIKSNN